MQNITELNGDNYSDFTSEGVVLVDIWSPTCGPCKAISPIIDEISDIYNGKVSVGKLNTGEYRDIAMNLGIRSIPTLLVYKDGTLVETSAGFKNKEEIKELLDKNIN